MSHAWFLNYRFSSNAPVAERAEKGEGEGERGKGRETDMREISATTVFLRLLTGAASARGLSPALTNLPEYWRRARWWPVVAAPRQRLPLPLQSQAVRRSPR